MNKLDSSHSFHKRLEGLRALVMLGQTKGPYAQQLLRILDAAKEQWGWQFDAVGPDGYEGSLEKFVGAQGKVFVRPRILEATAWEHDPERVRELDRLMSEAEFAANLPVGQIIASCPSSIGRAFVVAARRRMNSPMADRVLNDNAEPFRIIRRFFGFIEDMFDKSRPDVIFTIEWGTAFQSVVWLAAARRGIPCVALRRSKILLEAGYWTTDRLMENTAAINDAVARNQNGIPSTEAARARIKAFRESPQVASLVQVKWQKLRGQRRLPIKRWLKLPFLVAEALATDIVLRTKGFDMSQRAPALERAFEVYKRDISMRRHGRYLEIFDDMALERMKYVYFPLHKETDMPLTYQATPWQDQRNTIQLLSSVLPAGYSLLVREHRANFGQRPTEYYQHLLRLPNVILIDAFDSQFKYMRHANLIATENGSSGWEGLLLGRPVLTLAPNFYDGAGLTVHAYDVNQLGPKVLEALSSSTSVGPQSHDEHLGRMIDAELATAFTNEPDQIPIALERLASILSESLDSRADPLTGASCNATGVVK